MSADPRTPVVVGVGQAAERIDDTYYRAMSGVEVAAAGARAALVDCGADVAKVAATIDTVAGVRQFEISGPGEPVLESRTTIPRSVADRIGADPARAILEVVGGQGPQHLITELADEIATGRSEVALVFGSDATSTTHYFAGTDNRPDFSEAFDGSLEDRGPRPGPAGHALHRHPRPGRCADAICVAGECARRRNRAGANGIAAADGGAVRAVHQSRCRQSVRRGAGGT